MSGAGGSAGTLSCLPVDCADLSESACKSHPSTFDSDGCIARYGAPWPEEPSANPDYAGCAVQCCEGDEECPGTIAAEVCAINEAGECWTLWSPPVPEGWRELGIDGCDAYPECNE